jgi:hypothetical protein
MKRTSQHYDGALRLGQAPTFHMAFLGTASEPGPAEGRAALLPSEAGRVRQRRDVQPKGMTACCRCAVSIHRNAL